MIDDVNGWESNIAPATEKEKKEATRQRISSELEGNPNLPNKKVRKLKFAAPSKEDKDRMQYLDRYGNPLSGYKWNGLDIVEIATNTVVYRAPIKVIDSTEVQKIDLKYKGVVYEYRRTKTDR